MKKRKIKPDLSARERRLAYARERYRRKAILADAWAFVKSLPAEAALSVAGQVQHIEHLETLLAKEWGILHNTMGRAGWTPIPREGKPSPERLTRERNWSGGEGGGVTLSGPSVLSVIGKGGEGK